ncbi:MAG TPA: sugar ABC transporter permease, partial [Actinotalea sp.]
MRDEEVRAGRSDRPARAVRPLVRRFDALPYVLVAPVALFIVGLAIVPALFTIIESFFTVNELDPPTRFSGLDNFVQLFHNHAVMNSAANTALYVVVGVALSTVLGIAMAVLLQHPFRGRGIVIAILILPWALPGVVEGILWSG